LTTHNEDLAVRFCRLDIMYA